MKKIDEFKKTYKPVDRSKLAYDIKRKLLLKQTTMTKEQKVRNQIMLEDILEKLTPA